MRDNTTDQPGSPADDASLDAQFPAEVAALRETGAIWRTSHAPTVERGERRAHDSLRAWLAAPPEIDDALSARRRERRARWRPLRLATSLVALAAVVTLAAYGATRLAQPAQWHGEGPVPAPVLFTWNGGATLNSQTPQQAYAAAMTLTPCVGGPGSTFAHGAPPRSATVTWLAAGPNYGLVRIQPVCDPSARAIHLWLATIVRQGSFWNVQQGVSEGSWNPARDPNITPPPAWLPLPADTYAEERVAMPEGVKPPDSVVAWDAQTRLFVFGHVADSAIRPSGATSVVVDGHAGWVTTENDMTTVTVTLDDGSTLFFSGTASPAQTQALAADAFPHVNEVLENLHYPTVTPSGAAGLGG